MPTPPAAPITPGHQTSEHRLTVNVLYIGLAMEVASAFLDKLSAAGVGAGSKWFPVVMALVGGALQASSLLGYQRARALVKVAALTGTDGA